ncbi:hypothetical protein ASE59_11765 [Sphingomonas sp. Leaf10]|nr:hypothetical protein ASE59_11765 [Sphingomonas sp. Leaf10]
MFADEAGNFDFRRHPNVSNFYIICTVTMTDCAKPAALLTDLKRQLAWEKAPVRDSFHCTDDAQATRDRVFETILGCEFGVQATVMEKAKANPSIRKTDAAFYGHGWLYHLRHGLRDEIFFADELHITAASVRTKKEQVAFADAVRDVVRETVDGPAVRTSFWQCATDPCLQLADYCTWAIQRKWEKGDARSYDLIRDRVTYHYDLFARGKTLYF